MGFSRSCSFVLRVAALALALAPIACVAETEEESASSSSEIIKGVVATDYPEVVLVNARNARGQETKCSGTVIAPTIVLTGGRRCIAGQAAWTVVAPNANGQTANAVDRWTSYTATGPAIAPGMLDVGILVLDRPIALAYYPPIAKKPVANGRALRNVGRVLGGKTPAEQVVTDQLYLGKRVNAHRVEGFVNSYITREIIQEGDDGGPAFAGPRKKRKVAGVNQTAQGLNGKRQALARVDLAYDTIQGYINLSAAGLPQDDGVDEDAD